MSEKELKRILNKQKYDEVMARKPNYNEGKDGISRGRLIAVGEKKWNAEILSMSPFTLRLTIPSVPPSLNEWTRMHWSKQNASKQQWSKDIKYIAFNSKPDQPLKRAEVQVTYYFSVFRNRDSIDNYCPKWVMDGLKVAGIIYDDADKYVDAKRPILHVDPDNPRTEILITEILEQIPIEVKNERV